MKRNMMLILVFIILLIPILFYDNKENIIKELTFNQLENKKVYTFVIKELKNKKNSLEFIVKNHYVEIYIDNKLVYELKDNETLKVDKLIKIPLNKKHINKKVKIVLTPTNNEDIDNNLNLEIK